MMTETDCLDSYNEFICWLVARVFDKLATKSKYHEQLQNQLEQVVAQAKNGNLQSPACLWKLGSILRFYGHIDQAKSVLECGLAFSSTHNDYLHQTRILIQIGSISALQGKIRESLSSYHQALDLAEAHKYEAEHSAILHQIALVYQEQGKFYKARDLFQSVLARAELRNDSYDKAAAHFQLGQIYLILNDPSAARNSFQHSKELFSQLNDLQGLALTTQSLAQTELVLSDPENTLLLFKESLRLLEAIKDSGGKGTTLSKMADIHWELDEFGQAEQLMKQALAISKQSGHTAATALRQYKLGQLALVQNQREKAMNHFKEALELFKQLDRPEFLEIQSKVEHLSKIVDSPWSAYAPLASSAREAVKERDFASAVIFQNQVVNLVRANANEDRAALTILAMLQYDLARYYQALGDFNRAVESLEEAAFLSEKTNQPNLHITRRGLVYARWLAADSLIDTVDLTWVLQEAEHIHRDAIAVRRNELELELFLTNTDVILTELSSSNLGSAESDLKFYVQAIVTFLLTGQVTPIPFTYASQFTELLATRVQVS